VAAAPTPLGNAAAAVTGTFGQLTSSSFLRSSVAVQEVSILFLVAVRRVKPLAPRKDKGGNRLQFLRHSDWSDSRQREPSCLGSSRSPRTDCSRSKPLCRERRPASAAELPAEKDGTTSTLATAEQAISPDAWGQGTPCSRRLHVCSSWPQHGTEFCARLTQRRYLEYTLTGSQRPPPPTTASQRCLLRRHTTLNAPPFAYERTSIACLSRLSRIEGAFQTRLWRTNMQGYNKT